ncbi:Uncharacterised protein [Xylophilus ampelinus]|nr:hypothetical protein [Variovorax sp.]VTY31493.1 Uncharacterised protein [Xylophilus ampelinus]
MITASGPAHCGATTPAAGLLEHLALDGWTGVLVDEHGVVLSPPDNAHASTDPTAIALQLLRGVRDPGRHPINGEHYDLRHVSIARIQGDAVAVMGIDWTAPKASNDECLATGAGLPLRVDTRCVPLRRLADVLASRCADRVLVALVARESYFMAALLRSIGKATWAEELLEKVGVRGECVAVRDAPGLRALTLEFALETPGPDLDVWRDQALAMSIGL